MIFAIVIGAMAGAVIGFFFHKFVGCRAGTCVIAGNRYLSIAYWAVLGGLAGNIIAKF